MSDDGSDGNDCHSASAPCKNLQVVLDKAMDGADIYVTSYTLALDFAIVYISYWHNCVINSSVSYTLRSYHNSSVRLTCPGIHFLIFFEVAE